MVRLPSGSRICPACWKEVSGQPAVEREHHAGAGDRYFAYACCLGSTGNPAAFHAAQPPVRALALFHPARRSSRATRALVASSCQVQ